MALQTLTSVYAEVLTGRIVGISDGDTVTLLDANQRRYKIRLTGIDAPEKKMPFGQRSKEHLSDLVFSKDVQVETEKLDRYGRTLGKILLDHKEINLAMIKAGQAWHYKTYQKDQSRSDRLLYAHAEEQARQQRIELWRDPNPTAPWEWRKGERLTTSWPLLRSHLEWLDRKAIRHTRYGLSRFSHQDLDKRYCPSKFPEDPL